MRIIAGEWRGRRFEAPPTMDVRPTADRVRESWMSILQREIPEARVLDLCAGSCIAILEGKCTTAKLPLGAAGLPLWGIQHSMRT